ncbi:LysR family transcriptional regulator [Entomohabitans teleogrylli]|uniref:LysR family transcriptional regulator n=1 Tax=Entomohabitans teleogrylli TaxID=1384589 RepID=UPI00073DA08C|nr:LysR family transcriptional regulator [Entomohabitans teleogrylli]
MRYELQGIVAFVIVSELKCFTKAAEKLNISQPALTRRIKTLEENFGIVLFERSTRTVNLTPAGVKFLPDAQNLIATYEQSIMNVRGLSGQQNDLVTLSCIPTAAFYFLPEVISRFNVSYPNVRIKIREQSASDCMESVLNGDVDFGINMNNLTNPNVEFTPLVNEPFVLACRSDHVLAKQSLVSWNDLSSHKLIGVRRSSGNRLLIENTLAECGVVPQWFYEVRHLSTSLGLVAAGLGIAALPSLALPKDAHPTLISRPLVEPVIRRTLGLIKRRDTFLPLAATRFVDLLLALWVDQKQSPWTIRFHL